MQRRSFLIRLIATGTFALTATSPVLANAHGARHLGVRRHVRFGAVPGGCRDHRTRGSLGTYTLSDLLRESVRRA